MVTESSSGRRLGGLAAALALAVAALAGCGGSDEPAPSGSGSAAAASAGAGSAGGQVLLDAQALDVLDQAIAYPRKGDAQITSEVLTLEPGQESGWHRHRVPVFVYVMEGTLSVEYDAGVAKEYPAGTAYMEAEDIWHDVANKGDDTARFLVVYLGAKGAKNSVERSP